jgi:uncharacterized protein with PIN domain
MLLFADLRSAPVAEERFSRCLYCGRELVVLPDDRRRGSCFDCLALAVAPAIACPQCGATIPGDERALGCPECRWFPGRD